MISQDELKAIELDILKNVDQYCKDNKLTYYLAYGTLLGAIRHNGFIPWDDDIDIKMPRKDYERFIESFSLKGFSVYSHRHTKNYLYPFAKVSNDKTVLIEKSHRKPFEGLGVYIDVFPVDNLPDNRVLRYICTGISRIFRYIYISKTINVDKTQKISRYVTSKLIRLVTSLISTHSILLMWDKLLMKYQNNKQFLGCMVWGYGKREVMRSEEVLPPSHAYFEGCQFSAPYNADYYLKTLYNDYMKLPPTEKQVTHHDFVAEYKVHLSELRK